MTRPYESGKALVTGGRTTPVCTATNPAWTSSWADAPSLAMQVACWVVDRVDRNTWVAASLNMVWTLWQWMRTSGAWIGNVNNVALTG